MKKGKIKITIGVVAVIILGVIGFLCKDSILQLISSIGGSKESVYVEKVSELNGDTVGLTSRFGGVIETQDIYNIKADSAKAISEIHVEIGDVIEVGQALFTYDTRELQLEIDQKKLEIETMSNEIASNQQQIATLTQQLQVLPVEEQFEFQAEIQNLNNSISQLQYDMGCIQLEIDNLAKDIESATVKSEVSGTVKEINESLDEFSEDSAFMTILQGKEYRVKGSVDEQNVWNLSEGQDMIIRSRVDESKTWTGKITKIETSQVVESEDEYYDEYDVIKATKYPFYVSIDDPEGLLLGQHVYLEIDDGETEVKEGIWLSSSYVVEEDITYVWVSNSLNRLEKRVVELGEYDVSVDQYQIVSGLTEEDYIAWPMEGLYEGVATVTNIEDANWGDESYGTEILEDESWEDESWDVEDEYVEGTEWY